MPTPVFQCHRDSHEAHQWVSLVVAEWSWFQLPHDSHPAPRDLKPSVPVEAFLSRGLMDVESFLEWQFSKVLVFGFVHHCGLSPSDASMRCYCRFFPHPSLAGIPVPLQSGLKSPLALTNVGLASAIGDIVHHLGLLLHQQGVLPFGQRAESPPRSEDQLHAIHLADPWCLYCPLLCLVASSGVACLPPYVVLPGGYPQNCVQIREPITMYFPFNVNLDQSQLPPSRNYAVIDNPKNCTNFQCGLQWKIWVALK